MCVFCWSLQLENINVCLKCIENLGVNVEGLKAEGARKFCLYPVFFVSIFFFCVLDIREGNLRAILALFFSLSRYKQQKKSGILPPSSQQQTAPLFTKVPAFTAPPATTQNDDMLSRFEVLIWRIVMIFPLEICFRFSTEAELQPFRRAIDWLID